MAYTTINDPTDYFNTKLYSGNSSTQSITGVNFKPDLVWIKERTNTSSHNMRDIIRGTNKYISSDTTGAETTNTHLTSFDSDGFTLASSGGINNSGDTYVSWNFLGSNTTASNTDGSITSTVSANTTSGFSIVSYTGTGANATIGHGLAVAPKFIIIKVRNADRYWAVQTSTGAGFEMNLNVTEGQTATSVYWNSTDPTSSVFSVGTNAATNNSGDDYIAYVFAPIKGFSKFGSYTGNGSANGPMVYTGFKPAFVIIKQSSASGQNWFLTDNKRNEFNAVDKLVYADSSNAEVTSGSHPIDFLSNGFKCRGTGAGNNGSGATYIYAAFAESPFTTSTGVPTTAR